VIPPPPGTGWEEPTILASGLADDPVGFVESVRQVNPILAARCLTEAGIQAPTNIAENMKYHLLREMTDRRVHLRFRIAAGDVLGKLGDPRLSETVVNGQRMLLPPFVEIPVGAFWMGSGWRETVITWLNTGALLWSDESPRHKVELPTFYIGQYPVTNAEYECFVKARGYEDERWWRSQAAREWLKATTRNRPDYWNDALCNNPSQPVVGLTWFEANAYCAWLDKGFQVAGPKVQIYRNGKLETRNLVPATCVVRLPTEAEWEKAARGKRNWVYPWGNRWNQGCANTYGANTHRAVPVGIYPEGATPEGVFDLAGNVWEWTSTAKRDYPYKLDDRENPEGVDSRVARGGAFLYVQFRSRSTYRLGDSPAYLSSRRGFRLVLSPIKFAL
jgi:formylglycine-generating enzyme required for sulfatase activity